MLPQESTSLEPEVALYDWMLYAGADVVAEMLNDGSTDTWTDYILFAGLRMAQQVKLGTNNSVVTYLHTDHLGSTRVCTDANGNSNGTCDYEPFGENQPGTTCSVPTKFRFAGMQFDAETGFYHTWFRQYDPAQARWLGVDSVDGSAENSQTFNLYVYVLNDPINLIDPEGLSAQFIRGELKNCTADGITVDCADSKYYSREGTFICPVELGEACSNVTFGGKGEMWAFLPPTYFQNRIEYGWRVLPDGTIVFTIITGSNFQEARWVRIVSNSTCTSEACLLWLRRLGDFSSGAVNSWTLGFGTTLLGTSDIVDHTSGWYVGGVVTGSVMATAAGGLVGSGRAGLQVKIRLHGPHHKFPGLGPRGHVQVNKWLDGAKGSGSVRRWPINWWK